MSCDKVAYHSERAAQGAARRIRRTSGLPFRAYACPECSRWHVTSGDRIDVHMTAGPPRASRGRRPAEGESIEDLAARMRAERGAP